MSVPESRLATDSTVHYDAVAAEYYDADRHPTCRNFREASERLIAMLLADDRLDGLTLADVGAGDSVLAALLVRRGVSLDKLTLVDESSSMLGHSKEWIDRGAGFSISSADNLPFDDASVDVLIASLGDPFNETGFWQEVGRVLAPEGRFIFTTPSSEWARAYRSLEGLGMASAVFELTTGSMSSLPSLILDSEDQKALIAKANLAVSEIAGMTAASLTPPLSPKLCLTDGADFPIVTAYSGVKV